MTFPGQRTQAGKRVKFPTKRKLRGGEVDALFELTTGKLDAGERQPKEKTQDRAPGPAVLFGAMASVTSSGSSVPAPHRSPARAIALCSPSHRRRPLHSECQHLGSKRDLVDRETLCRPLAVGGAWPSGGQRTRGREVRRGNQMQSEQVRDWMGSCRAGRVRSAGLRAHARAVRPRARRDRRWEATAA